MYNIPLGFRFSPTEEELIRCFLYPKVMGLPLPWDGVRDRCVYGVGADKADPWNVFFDADRHDMESSQWWQTKKEGGSMKKTIYVFTSITHNSKRAARIAGCGTWSGQTGPKDITHSDTGEIIGYSRMLTFKIRKDSDMINYQDSLGHWIMHEYTLSDSTLRLAGLTHNHIVLCKITRIVKNRKIESTSQHHHHPLQIHPTAAPAEEVRYYSPENNTVQIQQTAAREEEVQYYYSENDTIQIHQTAAPAEEVQYYSPENNTIQFHPTAAPAEEVQYYYSENNTIQIYQTAAPTEEVQCYFLENNTAEEGDDHVNNNNKRSRDGQRDILEMQQQQQQQGGCKKQKSLMSTDEIENMYDWADEDFGELWQECQ